MIKIKKTKIAYIFITVFLLLSLVTFFFIKSTNLRLFVSAFEASDIIPFLKEKYEVIPDQRVGEKSKVHMQKVCKKVMSYGGDYVLGVPPVACGTNRICIAKGGDIELYSVEPLKLIAKQFLPREIVTENGSIYYLKTIHGEYALVDEDLYGDSKLTLIDLSSPTLEEVTIPKSISKLSNAIFSTRNNFLYAFQVPYLDPDEDEIGPNSLYIFDMNNLEDPLVKTVQQTIKTRNDHDKYYRLISEFYVWGNTLYLFTAWEQIEILHIGSKMELLEIVKHSSGVWDKLSLLIESDAPEILYPLSYNSNAVVVQKLSYLHDSSRLLRSSINIQNLSCGLLNPLTYGKSYIAKNCGESIDIYNHSGQFVDTIVSHTKVDDIVFFDNTLLTFTNEGIRSYDFSSAGKSQQKNALDFSTAAVYSDYLNTYTLGANTVYAVLINPSYEEERNTHELILSAIDEKSGDLQGRMSLGKVDKNFKLALTYIDEDLFKNNRFLAVAQENKIFIVNVSNPKFMRVVSETQSFGKFYKFGKKGRYIYTTTYIEDTETAENNSQSYRYYFQIYQINILGEIHKISEIELDRVSHGSITMTSNEKFKNTIVIAAQKKDTLAFVQLWDRYIKIKVTNPKNPSVLSYKIFPPYSEIQNLAGEYENKLYALVTMYDDNKRYVSNMVIIDSETNQITNKINLFNNNTISSISLRGNNLFVQQRATPNTIYSIYSIKDEKLNLIASCEGFGNKPKYDFELDNTGAVYAWENNWSRYLPLSKYQIYRIGDQAHDDESVDQ